MHPLIEVPESGSTEEEKTPVNVAFAAPTPLCGAIGDCTDFAIKAKPAITSLTPDQYITGHGLLYIIKDNQDLERLNLEGCLCISGRHLAQLFEIISPNLRAINLSITHVNLAGILAIFKRCPNLEVIQLVWVSDIGEEEIHTILEKRPPGCRIITNTEVYN